MKRLIGILCVVTLAALLGYAASLPEQSSSRLTPDILDIPGVTYATRFVWAVPDSYLGFTANLMRDLSHNYIGGIDEFIENPWETQDGN